jgi:cytidylate kinase
LTTIVGVSGPARSGKSTVAKGVAAATGGDRVSFGDYVRRIAVDRGFPERRQQLQALGQELLDELGPDEFTARVLADTEEAATLVVDGVRHLSVNDVLARRADRYLLVFVELDQGVRRSRLEELEGDSLDLSGVDDHSTECEAPALRGLADLVLDGADDRAWEKVVALLG